MTAGRLEGARAIVTGAARGIGRAIARGIAAEGSRVACLDLDRDGVADTVRRIEADGGRGLSLGCDVTDWDRVRQSVDRVVEEFGAVDVLVANAGGSAGETRSFLELDPQAWARMVDRNLTSAFYSGLACARQMASAGGGAIVMVSSQLCESVRPGLAHYAAAKGGVRQLVKGMAVDLAPHGIRVNAIAPGPTLTPGNREFFSRPEVREVNERSIPLGRVAQPEEMVGAVVYLAGDEASFVTGTTLFVDGGYTIV